jgi:protein TonB
VVSEPAPSPSRGAPPGFRAFGAYRGDDRPPRPWIASLAASTGVYVLLAVLALVVGTTAQQVVREKKVDLTFVEKVVQEPPPPRVEAPPATPPPAAAPVVRPEQKIRKLEKPPPPKELVAPKDMPQEAPKEADPSEDKGVAVYGEGKGDPAGLEGGTAGGVAGGVAGAIALPEDAEPPLPTDGNLKPPYPQEARATGKMGTVVLKVVVLADGRVGDVQVMRGEEPFASAAVKAVKTWRYTPARYKGVPITVYRIIQIPFKLTA